MIRRALTWGVVVTLVGGVLVLATAVISFAQQATGTPTIYKVTVKKVEFSSDGGTTFVTLKEADQEMDIASVNAGALAANYASGATLPAATYNRIRVTISCTIKLRGNVSFGGITYYTTSTGGTSAVAGNLAEGSYTVPAGAGCAGGQLTSTDTVSFAVIEGQGKTMNVSFDVTGSIRLDGAPGGATLSPNTVTVSYSTQ
jgi:hypothetical protein